MPDTLTTDINWLRCSFQLMRRQEISRAGIITQARDLGPAIWVAEYETVPMVRSAAEALTARFLDLGGALTTFFCHTANRPQPITTVGGSVPSGAINFLTSDRRTFSVSGLPHGTELSPGDYLSVTNGVGTELIQLSKGGVAGVDMTAYQLRSATPLRPILEVGDPVRLENPVMEARLEPGSLVESQIDTMFSSLSFTAVQVIR